MRRTKHTNLRISTYVFSQIYFSFFFIILTGSHRYNAWLLVYLLPFFSFFGVHIGQNWNMRLPRLSRFDICKGKMKHINIVFKCWTLTWKCEAFYFISLISHLWPYQRISSYGFYFTLIGPKIKKTIWFIDLSSIVSKQCVCMCMWCFGYNSSFFYLAVCENHSRVKFFCVCVVFLRWLTKEI